jgi:hypothetical protein
MADLANHSQAEVKYSLNTMSGDVEPHPGSYSYHTDGMASPVFTVAQGSSRIQIR